MNNKDDEFFKQLEKDAVVLNLEPTFDYLTKLNETKEGVLVSEYPTINGVPIRIYKDGRFFKFDSRLFSHVDPTVQPYLYQSEMYGYICPFFIINRDELFILENGGYNISINFANDSAEGSISNINNRKSEDKKYYRSVQPIQDNSKAPENYLKTTAIKTSKFLKFNGYVEFIIDELQFSFFSCTIDKDKFLIIDSLCELDFSQFENIVEAILECFALISGSLHRYERTIFGSKDRDFEEISDFSFIRLDDSIVSNHELFNYGELYDAHGFMDKDRLPIEVFSYLVNMTIKDKRILRAIKLITQTYDIPIEARASSLFVALETIKNVILDKNEESVSLIKNKNIAKEIIDKFKVIISEIDSDQFNNRDALYRKLESINKIGNNDGLLKIFDLYGIVLNKADKDCVAARNRFLHGAVPVKTENRKDHERNIAYITLRTQFLISILLLKVSGYSGYVKCSYSFLDKFRYGDLLDEPLFRKI